MNGFGLRVEKENERTSTSKEPVAQRRHEVSGSLAVRVAGQQPLLNGEKFLHSSSSSVYKNGQLKGSEGQLEGSEGQLDGSEGPRLT